MKRLINFFVGTVICALITSICVPAFAYTIPSTIRVGIEYRCKEVDKVQVGNTSLAIGMSDKDVFFGEAEISAKTGFSVSVPWGKTVDANEFYGKYDEAVLECNDIKKMWGYDAVPAYTDKKLWGVYICGLSDGDAKNAATDLGGSIVNSSRLMFLIDGDKILVAFNGVNPQFSPMGNDKAIKLGDRSYRGVMEFGRYNGGKITAVNVVGLDQYLYGAVPSEMPSSWHAEALKAQAVAARSYALNRIGVHAKSGYDLCDGTNCQVYIGVGQEKKSTNDAVDATSNIVAYYDDMPINAVFSASSGGSTDNAENVWANPVAYLKAVPEINEIGVDTWTRTYTAVEMKDILASKGINLGDVENVEITSVGAYGRVQEVTITGTKGTRVLKKEETRTIFSGTKEGSLNSRMYTINGNGGSNITVVPDKPATESKTVYVSSQKNALNISLSDTYVLAKGGKQISGGNISEAYAIAKGNKVAVVGTKTPKASASINAPPSLPTKNSEIATSGEKADTFVFVGKGLGHGVGMSQYGAKGMAEQGYKYDEILKHYYTGITLG